MTRKLVLTDGAVRDLTNIRAHLEAYGREPDSIKNELLSLLEKFEWIGQFPGNPGKLMDSDDYPDLYSYPCGSFSIYYLHLEHSVKIVAVIHSSELEQEAYFDVPY